MTLISERSSGLESSFSAISLSLQHSSKLRYRESIETQQKPNKMEDTIDQDLLLKQPWVRSAGKTNYRLKGFYITRENFEILFQSFDEEREARVFAGQLLYALSIQPIRLRGEEALRVLEENWTGNIRPKLNGATQPSRILAQFRISYYVSTRWEIVKEVSYLAVSEDLLDFLFEFAITSKSLNSLLEPEHSVIAGISNLTVLCERLQKRSVGADLNSAIRGDTLSVRMDPIIGMLYCQKCLAASSCDNSDNEYEADEEHKIGARSISQIVDEVYEMVKIGRRTPSEPFLRVSSAHTERVLPLGSSTGIKDLIRVVGDSPDIPEDASIDDFLNNDSDLCMFLTHRFEGQIRLDEMGHAFGESVRYRPLVHCVQVDGHHERLTWLSHHQIQRTIEIAKEEELPFNDVNHDGKGCNKCALLPALLRRDEDSDMGLTG